MYDQSFIIDLFEEQLVKGHFRWLANFNEIHRDFKIDDIEFPIYASGGLQEKGFLLSRIYSALVVPKYKVRLLLHIASEIDTQSLRRIVIALKREFGMDDWIFVVLMQNQRLGKAFRESVNAVEDKTVGICAYSVSTKESVTSNNFLGRGLAKQLRLGKVTYEKVNNSGNLPTQGLLKKLEAGNAEYGKFDVPNYLKSFTLTFALGIALLVFIGLSGFPQATSTLTLAILFVLSLVIGQLIYKSRYHISVLINRKGFALREGDKIRKRNWHDYSSLSLFVSSQLETFLRLKSKEETFDLPISRPGIPRRELYEFVRQLTSS